ncbi:cytochrome P450 [Congregibacter litoralis]|uniref:Cytochrome P450 n=1 Tax=Congregibacter litoralis KT71 TaxID=314285 RepID=A4A9V8_9GAMM|nr:cytochrome P450 [Congregibacter litoralis]EAQ97275.1 Cytochrome P450 [Congregibacter litoralis KT71]
MSQDTLYIPPKPHSLAALPALFRVLWNGDGNLLDLLPAAAYRFPVGNLGYSRRSTVLFNDPALVRHIMRDPDGIFPKSDLMVNALEHLIGESIFVTDGQKWRRQRAMIDPAFSHMRISHAFAAMQAAVNDYVRILEASAESGEPLSLDRAMSQLTADIICRTVFSTSLDSQVAFDVFEDFMVFERSVAQVDIKRLIFEPAWTKAPQPQIVLDACTRIRRHLASLIDTHLAPDAEFNDIASAVIAARDSDSGEPFSRDELIDQLGVFFLAGHETTASVLTWLFFICAQQPSLVAKMRREIDSVVAVDAAAGKKKKQEPLTFEHMRQLPLLKAVFREALRLYPPITFMPRVALEDTTVGPRKLPKGALVMISPWTLHRHRDYWDDPHAFKPERFLPDNEASLVDGAYIPFGQGPHTCVGAGFAQTESLLIIAELLRRFDFEALNPGRVRPAARLTTRPREQIFCRVTRRVQS